MLHKKSQCYFFMSKLINFGISIMKRKWKWFQSNILHYMYVIIIDQNEKFSVYLLVSFSHSLLIKFLKIVHSNGYIYTHSIMSMQTGVEVLIIIWKVILFSIHTWFVLCHFNGIELLPVSGEKGRLKEEIQLYSENHPNLVFCILVLSQYKNTN